MGRLRNSELILLSAIIIMALFLQSYSLIDGLSHDDIWMAEIFSNNILTLFRINDTADIPNVPPDDGPLYFWLMHFWIKAFGLTEASMLSFSILLGIMSIPLLFLLGKRLFNGKVALLACLLFSLSLHFIENSQLIRPYTLYLFLSLASMIYFYDYSKSSNKKDLILFSVFTLLNIYTHYFAFLLLDIQIIFILFFSKKGKKEFIATSIIIYMLSVPMLARIFDAVSYNKSAAGPNPCFAFAFLNAVHYNALQYSLVILQIAFFVAGVLIAWKRERKTAIMAGMLFFIPVLFSILLSCEILFKIKHFLFLFPYFFLAISLFILSLKSKKSRVFLLSVLVLLSSFSLFDYYSRPTHSDWKSSFQYINKNFENGDIVIITDYANRPAGYYLDSKPLIGKALTVDEIIIKTADYKRVWLVVHEEGSVCDDCRTENMDEIKDYFDAAFAVVDEKRFIGGETLHDIPAMDIILRLYRTK